MKERTLCSGFPDFFCMYYYDIFPNGMTDSQMENALSNDIFIPVNDRVVFACTSTFGPDDAVFSPEVKRKSIS